MSAIEIVHVRHGSTVAAVPSAAGPSRLLEAGLVRRLESVGSRVGVSEISLPVDRASNPIAEAFEVARLVRGRVRAALNEGKNPIVLSGSCHTAIGSVSALEGTRRGVVWLDAHGDFNTPETTVSGLLDGTTLATVTGRCYAAMRRSVEGFEPVKDGDVLTFGVRKLDPGEQRLLQDSGVVCVATQQAFPEIDRLLVAYGRKVEDVYLHLDLDVLDRSSGVANAYSCSGGFSASALEGLVRMVALATPARVLALTSYDPRADADGRACEAALKAVQAFVEARLASNDTCGSARP